MTVKKDTDLSAMSFEQSLKELEAIVRKLEGGQGDLEASIVDYTSGMAFKAHCLKKLAAAKLQVEKIIKNNDGTLSVQPFDTEN